MFGLAYELGARWPADAGADFAQGGRVSGRGCAPRVGCACLLDETYRLAARPYQPSRHHHHLHHDVPAALGARAARNIPLEERRRRAGRHRRAPLRDADEGGSLEDCLATHRQQRRAYHGGVEQRRGCQLAHGQERADNDIPRRPGPMARDQGQRTGPYDDLRRTVPYCAQLAQRLRGNVLRPPSRSCCSALPPSTASAGCRWPLWTTHWNGSSPSRTNSSPRSSRSKCRTSVRRSPQQHVARPEHVRRRAQASGVQRAICADV